MDYNKLVSLNNNVFLILIISVIINACIPFSSIPEDRLLIEMEKTACYGSCPVYTLEISKQGRGIFEGVENIDFTGKYRFSLSTRELDELAEAFREINFFGLEDRYHKLVTDLPTTYITYHEEGKTKKIMDYYGAPQELKDLEKQIESMVLSKKMKKIK